MGFRRLATGLVAVPIAVLALLVDSVGALVVAPVLVEVVVRLR